MKRSRLAEAAVGLALTALVAWGYLVAGALPALEGLELKAYDRRAKLRATLDSGQEIVLVAVDDASLSALGNWPWPRSRLADLLEALRGMGPRVVGLDLPCSEPSDGRGLAEVRSLQRRFEALRASRRIIDRTRSFDQLFSSATARLDSDARLLAALQDSGNVVLPIGFARLRPGRLLQPLPPVISSATVALSRAQAVAAAPANTGLVFPWEPFLESALGAGYAAARPDIDGVVRAQAPVLRYGGRGLPSFALALAAAYLGVKPSGIVCSPGRVTVGDVSIPLDRRGRMLVSFVGPEGTFRSYSASDVLGGKTPPDAFKNKLVLVGLTATGIGRAYATAVTPSLPEIELEANAAENIIHRRFLVRPDFARALELGLIGAIGLLLMFVLPRLRILSGFLLFLFLETVMLGTGTYLFLEGQWLKVSYPAVLLLAGYLLLALGRLLSERPAKPTLGRFRLEREQDLGAAGVLPACDSRGRKVFLKTMRLEAAAKERLLRDARLAAKLEHPGIARVLGCGEEAGLVYVAMEPPSGRNLAICMKEERLSAGEALQAAAAAADALDYAHAHGAVHGDVRPQNIELRQDGGARLLGFGLAASKTAAELAAGAAYMSPEQAAGRGVDGRSDLFSLTAVLFELLTGRKPFSGEEGTLLFRIANEPHPDPLALRPGLPPAVKTVIDRGLAKDPARRYPRAGELARDLRAC
ncbi:MAG: CHASE2 domain-containing protein, partial [Elusimicrobia bacterium]|nr:CHASE2 domain-containing protein [Elusimicrobiota bacterium]